MVVHVLIGLVQNLRNPEKEKLNVISLSGYLKTTYQNSHIQ